MIKIFDDPSKNVNSLSSEEMLILQARILASTANLVKNSNLLETFPSSQLLGNPRVEELERLHHYYDNAFKNNRNYEFTPAMEKEISAIPRAEKDRFIDGLVGLLEKEKPISIECQAYIIKIVDCFEAQQTVNHLRADELVEAVDSGS